jgi:hypothetical protein
MMKLLVAGLFRFTNQFFVDLMQSQFRAITLSGKISLTLICFCIGVGRSVGPQLFLFLIYD